MSTTGPGAVARRRVVVHGRVHGVGFRASCARRAAQLGLGGFVRNRHDGTVEAVFEGEPTAVGALVSWCHDGPALAQVTHVEVTEEPPAAERAFVVR